MEFIGGSFYVPVPTLPQVGFTPAALTSGTVAAGATIGTLANAAGNDGVAFTGALAAAGAVMNAGKTLVVAGANGLPVGAYAYSFEPFTAGFVTPAPTTGSVVVTGTTPLKIAFGGSSTYERFFTEANGEVSNPRVTASTNGTSFATLGTVGSGAHALGDILVNALNRDVRFIKGNEGGSTLQQWEAAGSTLRTGLVNAIIAAGGVDYLLYHGSNGGAANIDQAAWEALLRSLFAKIRAETGLPNLKIILGTTQRGTVDVPYRRWIKQAELNVGADANNLSSPTTYDLEQQSDELHQTAPASQRISAARVGAVLLASINGTTIPRGPRILSAAPVYTTATDLTIAHGTGTDFTPTSAIQAVEVSLDNGTTWETAAGARRSATVVRLAHRSTAAGLQIRVAEDVPYSLNILHDNNDPPLPLEPTLAVLNVAATSVLDPSGPPTLGVLAITGTAPNTALPITGATPGSTITGTSLPSGTTIDSANRTITFATSGAKADFQLVETLAGATGSPKSTTISGLLIATYSDNWRGATGSLGTRTANTGQSYTLNNNDIQTFITAGVGTIYPPGSSSIALVNYTPASSPRLKAPFIFKTDTAASAFLILKHNNNAPASATYAYAGYQASIGKWVMYTRVNGGTGVLLASVAYTPVFGTSAPVVEFICDDTVSPPQYRLEVDGVVTLAPTASSAITAQGKIGFNFPSAGSNSTGIHIGAASAA